MASYYTLGSPEYRRDGGYGRGFWMRTDTYHTDSENAQDLNGGRDSFHCTGPDDMTPSVNRDKDYDGTRCPMCYLGYCHTQAYHNRDVAAYNSNRTQEAH